MVRNEDESVLHPQVDGELAGTVGAESMAPARGLVHIPERWRGAKSRQPTLEQGPMFRAPPTRAGLFARAALLQLAVGPRDLDVCSFDLSPLGL